MGLFPAFKVYVSGGVGWTSPAFRPVIELELCENQRACAKIKEHVARHETKAMGLRFETLGQL